MAPHILQSRVSPGDCGAAQSAFQTNVPGAALLAVPGTNYGTLDVVCAIWRATTCLKVGRLKSEPPVSRGPASGTVPRGSILLARLSGRCRLAGDVAPDQAAGKRRARTRIVQAVPAARVHAASVQAGDDLAVVVDDFGLGVDK